MPTPKLRKTALVAQLCLTLFATPLDCSTPGSSVHGILQAIILEWVTNSFSNVWAQLCPILCDPMDGSLLGSFVHGIFQQEYWSGLQFSTSEDLPYPGIKSVSSALSGRYFTTEPPGKPENCILRFKTITERKHELLMFSKRGARVKEKRGVISISHLTWCISFP